MDIRHCTYHHIDKRRWDDCISRSANRLIYAESVYLDHMSPGWEALIADDYQAVMPLCRKKKWGFDYLYQPPFIQQLGIFSEETIDLDLAHAMILKMTGIVRFAEITLNHANSGISGIEGLRTTARNNFILSLQKKYEERAEGFNSYIRQRYNKASKNDIEYRSSTDVGRAVSLYKNLYQKKLPAFTDDAYEQFEKLCRVYQEQGRVIIREVVRGGTTDTLALVLLLSDGQRLYNMASSLNPEGKKLLANYHLFHELIREFSGSGLLLDFEGSDNPGIAFFYEKMADGNQTYPFLRYNRLPWPIRWLK